MLLVERGENEEQTEGEGERERASLLAGASSGYMKYRREEGRKEPAFKGVPYVASHRARGFVGAVGS